MHHRFSPKRHRFSYGLFLFALDLDELDQVDERLRFFSNGAANVYSFREDDFLPFAAGSFNPDGVMGRAALTEKTLRGRIAEWLMENGIDLDGGRVELVTMCRMFGYRFNPVSFYLCYDRENQPLAAIAEVTNTFGEVKPFLLGPECFDGNAFRLRVPKNFYVSPFSDVDVCFDFKIPFPNGKLAIQIDDYEGSRRTLTSALAGKAVTLSTRNLISLTLRSPLVPFRVITLIHWEALRLFLKKIPWFAKASRPDSQRGLLRPHDSLKEFQKPAPHGAYTQKV